ncbi:hypothetical protein QBC43DRAFT_363022 [Cladorrhinum sp. PSN259]|nr:hypothetical protein QBC43DRAFT_363022 [Cladorrhinum sp. PSN259]
MEIISAVASGVTLVDTAVRLAQTCIRLQQFWESVKDAPDDVSYILNDLQLVRNILVDIAEQKDMVPSVQVVLSTCLDRAEILEAIVRDFESSLAPSHSKGDRLWAAIKFTTKDKKLRKFRGSLSDAKQTLMLGLMYQNIQRPKLAFTNQDAQFVSVAAPNSLNADEQLRNPVLTKRFDNLGDDVSEDGSLPPYSPASCLHDTATELPRTDAPPKAKRGTTAAIVSSKAVQKFMQQALHMAVDNLFASGTVEELMDETLNRVTTFESISLGTCTKDGSNLDPGNLASQNGQGAADQKENRPSQGRRGSIFSRTRVCHQTSSMGVVLGSIWVRTSTLKVDDGSDSAGRKLEVITSFIFYPASWLSRLGIGYGTEASLNYSMGNGWKFNFIPVRAVAEDSLIFELCRRGETQAVQLMLARGDASFAAVGGHVELCAVLLEAGADKNALAYEGPAENALSAITMFAETAQAHPAAEKIQMLRLFADTLDLSDPSGDGWTVITSLVKALNKESVPMTEISANWLLRLTGTELVVACGARTLWDGLQHAVRSFLSHQQDSQILLDLLELESAGGDAKGGCHADDHLGIEMRSLGTAMSHWLALRASQRELLPMIVEAGRFLKMESFDWIEDNITPREYVRGIPAIYNTWTKVLPDGIENLRNLVEEELEYILGSLRIDRDRLKDAIRAGQKEVAYPAQDKKVCSECRDSYVKLGAGLVQPRLIVFDECWKTGHKRECECKAFLNDLGITGTMYATHSEGEDSESEVDEEFFADDLDEALLDRLCHAYNKMHLRDSRIDPFHEAATLLYRAQGRMWLSSYEPRDVLCATCFLKREHYISADGDSRGQDFTPMPEAYGAFAPSYEPVSSIVT